MHHVYFECNKVHERSCTSLFFRIKYPRTLCTGSLLDEVSGNKAAKVFSREKKLDLILKIRRIHQSKFSVYFLCVLVTSTVISRTEFILWGSFKAIISHTRGGHIVTFTWKACLPLHRKYFSWLKATAH